MPVPGVLTPCQLVVSIDRAVITRARQGAVSRVELLANGIPVLMTTEVSGADTYIFDWDTSARIPGEHVLEVKAFNSQGSFALSDPIIVHVDAIEDPDEDGPPGSVMWRAAGYSGEIKGSVAIGFNNETYQLIQVDRVLLFDGSASVGLFDIDDWTRDRDLLDLEPQRRSVMEKRTKAIIQRFNSAMVKNRLTLE